MGLNRYFNKLNQTPIIALTLVIAAGVGFSAGNLGNSGDSMNSGLEWSNQITIEKNGEQVDQFHNNLTNQGKTYIAGELFGDDPDDAENTTNNFEYISVGTASEGDITGDVSNLTTQYTKYNLSISEVKAEDKTTPSIGSYKLSYEFKANLSNNFDPNGDNPPDSVKVNATGLNYDSTDTSMVSGGTFTNSTLNSGDKLTVTHDITISDGG